MAPAMATYTPRDPSHTVLYTVIAEHLETLLASRDAAPDATGLPAYVERAFYDYVRCGLLAHGFLRLGCDTCHHELRVPCSGKRRGFCPSGAGRRMAPTAAPLVEQVLPWVPTRPWGVSVPIPLRYGMAASQDLTATVHTIIRTTIGQYYVHKISVRGFARASLHPGSVTLLQRFGSALNLNLHCHVIGLAGVYRDRPAACRQPRFVTAEPPTDAASAAVVQTISRRVIRQLRHRGYLETGLDAVVATDYAPLVDNEPALARTLAAAVQQRIAFGERTGQQVRRLGVGLGHESETPKLTGPRWASMHGFSVHTGTAIPAHRRDQLACRIRYTARGAVSLERLAEDTHGDRVYTFTHPWSDGTTGMRLAPLELLEQLAALVPLPRVHLGRSGGCLAPHSALRHAIMPTPRQQGRDGEESKRGTPYWPWARLLQRVFALERGPCPLCQRGVLRLLAVITQGEVLRKLRRHLKLSADPPPSRLPVPATHHVTGSPQPTTTRVGSEAPCAPGRGWHPAARVPSRPSAPFSDLPDCLQCTVAAGGRRWDTHVRRAKGLLIFLSTPALNTFQRSAWMPLHIHPPNIFPRNFLLAQIADGWINLVPYSPFISVTIFNLAYGVEWHGCSLSGWWNLRRL